MRIQKLLRLIFATSLLCLLAPTAWAGPTDPVTVTTPPVGQGDAFVPGTRLVEDLPKDYVEEEFFVSGAATLYNYAHNPPLGPTDITPIQTDIPYQTRIIVRRPEKANKFNGTVVIEWWNSTANFDTAPSWDASAEYFARNGVAYVGVTNANQAMNFLVGGCRLFGFLPPTCGTRYSTLSLPNDGLAYEMVSQLAHLLKSGGAGSPLPESYEVDRLFHVGQSQQGGSVIAYASGFDFADNDGYFVQSAGGSRRINGGPVCGSEPPFYPDCTPVLQGADRLVRTDLPVPVYQILMEQDISGFSGPAARQADTPTFRYYEVAGAAHSTVHKDIELIPAFVIGPDPIFLEDLCLNQLNTTADGPVFASHVINALWERMQEQVDDGDAPPAGVLMDVVAGIVQRDAFGNGLGGVRLASMDAPIATYEPGNQADPSLPGLLQFIGNLVCALSGSVFPFDQATLDTLYPDHSTYQSQVVGSVNALKAQGLLLQSDAVSTITEAAQSGIGD